jgi:hypothetical protein
VGRSKGKVEANETAAVIVSGRYQYYKNGPVGDQLAAGGGGE